MASNYPSLIYPNFLSPLKCPTLSIILQHRTLITRLNIERINALFSPYFLCFCNQLANPFSHLFTRLIKHSNLGINLLLMFFFNNKTYSHKLKWCFILAIHMRQNRHSAQPVNLGGGKDSAPCCDLWQQGLNHIPETDLFLQT